MATELTLLGEEAAAALILRSTRRQPALLVQGDTLSVVAQVADDLVSELESGNLEDGRQSAGEVAERLREWLRSYERMMRAAGLGLPY